MLRRTFLLSSAWAFGLLTGRSSRGEVPLSPSIKKHVDQVRRTPPSCLEGFRARAVIAEPWQDFAEWSLVCKCGSSKGRCLGYPLPNPNYKGPLLYISPIGFLCSGCSETTEIIDTEKHGYDAAIRAKSGEPFLGYHGSGPRSEYPCQHCGMTELEINVFCGHSHFDFIGDHPELASSAQDYFDSFSCKGVCAACGKSSWLAEFELG